MYGLVSVRVLSDVVVSRLGMGIVVASVGIVDVDAVDERVENGALEGRLGSSCVVVVIIDAIHSGDDVVTLMLLTSGSLSLGRNRASATTLALPLR